MGGIDLDEYDKQVLPEKMRQILADNLFRTTESTVYMYERWTDEPLKMH